MKKCGRCQIIKEDTEFSPSQLKISGGKCRVCNTEVCREYREKNPDKIKKYNQEYGAVYYQENKEEISERKKDFYQENKEEILQDRKEYYEENKETKLEYNKKYYQENREQILKDVKEYALNHQDEIKEYHNAYNKEKRETDLNFQLKTSISANISYYLKSNGLSKNKQSTLKYLSYTMDQLKEHLEKLFKPWMTWDNYGRYDTKIWRDDDPITWTWQIDHIIPHSTFNYTSMADDDFKKCWSLNNLRPLSSKQNFLDGVKRVRH